MQIMNKALYPKKLLPEAAASVLTFLIALTVLFPIVWLFFSSFKSSSELFAYPLHMLPKKITAESYMHVMQKGFLGYIKNSLYLAVIGTLITLIISAMCGYALAVYRREIRYTNVVFGILLLGTLVPGETLTVPQFSVISALGLYNNIWGCILATVTTTTGIFLYRQFYLTMPLSFIEAARIDGADELKIFSRIMAPLASSVSVTLTIFSFMWRWNDYILPLLVLSDQRRYTIQIAIKNYIGHMGTDWNSILAASIISIAPIIILFIILQKYIIGGIVASGVKG
jgi:alpha-1,4-digalacturonate transport system permease protein